MKSPSIFQQNCKEVLSSPSRSARSEKQQEMYFLSPQSTHHNNKPHLFYSVSDRSIPLPPSIVSASATSSESIKNSMNSNSKKSIFAQQKSKQPHLTSSADIIDWVSGNSSLSFEQIMKPNSSALVNPNSHNSSPNDHRLSQTEKQTQQLSHNHSLFSPISISKQQQQYKQAEYVSRKQTSLRLIDAPQYLMSNNNISNSNESETASNSELEISVSSTRRSRRKQPFMPINIDSDNNNNISSISTSMSTPSLFNSKAYVNQAKEPLVNLNAPFEQHSTPPSSQTNIKSIYDQFLKHTTEPEQPAQVPANITNTSAFFSQTQQESTSSAPKAYTIRLSRNRAPQLTTSSSPLSASTTASSSTTTTTTTSSSPTLQLTHSKPVEIISKKENTRSNFFNHTDSIKKKQPIIEKDVSITTTDETSAKLPENDDDDDDYFVPRQKSNTADMSNPAIVQSLRSHMNSNAKYPTAATASSLYKSILKNPNLLEKRGADHSNAHTRSSSLKRVQFANTHE